MKNKGPKPLFMTFDSEELLREVLYNLKNEELARITLVEELTISIYTARISSTPTVEMTDEPINFSDNPMIVPVGPRRQNPPPSPEHPPSLRSPSPNLYREIMEILEAEDQFDHWNGVHDEGYHTDMDMYM